MTNIFVASDELNSTSTSDMFKGLIAKHRVPENKHFQLLAQIRLSKSFSSLEGRRLCVKSRLEAILAVLFVHDSSDVLNGFFQAQPEFCHEIVDLVSERSGGSG